MQAGSPGGATGWYLARMPNGSGNCDHCGGCLKHLYQVVNHDRRGMTVESRMYQEPHWLDTVSRRGGTPSRTGRAWTLRTDRPGCGRYARGVHHTYRFVTPNPSLNDWVRSSTSMRSCGPSDHPDHWPARRPPGRRTCSRLRPRTQLRLPTHLRMLYSTAMKIVFVEEQGR